MRTFWHAVAYVICLICSVVAFVLLCTAAASWVLTGDLPTAEPLPASVVRAGTIGGVVLGAIYAHLVCFGGR